VIGTTVRDAKAEIARAAGSDHVIVGRDADIASAVTTITAGRGADYAIDGIDALNDSGKTTYQY